MSMCTCLCAHVCTHACTHACTHIRARNGQTNARTNAHAHARTNARTHAHNATSWRYVSTQKSTSATSSKLGILYIVEKLHTPGNWSTSHVDDPFIEQTTTQMKLLKAQESLTVPPHLRDVGAIDLHIGTPASTSVWIKYWITEWLVEWVEGIQILRLSMGI